MTNILTQEEVDALLRGISGGEIETEVIKEPLDPSEAMPYDLTSQDRIIRGRMPTLEMLNERFVRMFRTSLSSLLRKVVSFSTLSIEMIKFGDFLKTLPVPTSLHVFRMEPLKGSAIFVVESKVIFTLVDVFFGGTGRDPYRVEGRDFSAIENNLIKRVIISALSDLEKAWSALIGIKMSYQRSETNPQFAQIVPPTDLVILINYEIEMEFSSGGLSLCIPYSTLEPVREKLQAGFQSDTFEVDKVWQTRFKEGLMASKVELQVELGKAEIRAREVVSLQKGDVVILDQFAADPLSVFVQGILKFGGQAGNYKGNQAVRIQELITGKEEAHQYGTE
ncbi:MAG TPA: flagellar motor switch protein FliM [Syntrophales bacterium]|nr:flagellar motor switch protein FliM [Syntrophales bacterium]